VTAAVNIPVIASGGAGSIQHFVDVFKETGADAALAASIFHFGEIAIRDVKTELEKAEIPVRIEESK
jgi:cyclase